MQVIHTDDAPSHTGPVPQAVEAGGWIYVSALFGADPGRATRSPTDARGRGRAAVRQPGGDPGRGRGGADRRGAGRHRHARPAARPPGVQRGVGASASATTARPARRSSPPDFGRAGENARFMIEVDGLPWLRPPRARRELLHALRRRIRRTATPLLRRAVRAAAAAGFTRHRACTPTTSPRTAGGWAGRRRACARCSPTTACGWSRSSSSAAGRSTGRRADGPWPRSRPSPTRSGGRHVSAGEFRPAPDGASTSTPRRPGSARSPVDWGSAGCWWLWRRSRGRRCPTSPTAVELLRRAGAANAGLMVDVWHFFNGGARPDAARRACRPVRVAAVQLNDGPLVHDDFLRHARAERRLPGEGDLDVVGPRAGRAAQRVHRAVLRRGEHPGVPRAPGG